MTWLDEARATIGGAAETVGGSVVGIGHRWGVGSGVVLERGKILTNAHNLRGDEVRVTFFDGRSDTGRVVGADVDGDLGVIQVDTAGATPITWVEDPGVAIGMPVLALANPGGRGLRVTFGFVSGTARSFRGPRGRRITGSLEHTAPLLPGSSGGPVVDERGRMLGLNTNRLGEGFYLALPADADLRARADGLARGEAPARPRLGIGIAPPELAQRLRRAVGLSEAEGLLVREVEDDGPAARAGIAEGDLIVAAGDGPVATADDLYEALDGAASRGELTLKVLRGDTERAVAIVLGSAAA